MQRLADALGLSLVTALFVCWGLSAAVVVAGLLILLLGGPLALGVALFVVGMIGSFAVTTGMLRARAAVPTDTRKRPGSAG